MLGGAQVCLGSGSVYVCLPCMWVPEETRRRHVGFPGAGVSYMAVVSGHVGPREAQPVLITSEPSLSPMIFFLFFILYYQ